MATCTSCNNYVVNEGEICNKCYQSFGAPDHINVSGFSEAEDKSKKKKEKKKGK
jgi:hypothetical protein